MGDLYNHLGCSISEDSFILIGGFIFGLFLVVSDNLLHPFFNPIVGEICSVSSMEKEYSFVQCNYSQNTERSFHTKVDLPLLRSDASHINRS